MLKIKLSRTGKRNQPTFRIVISEAKSKRDGKYVENIGFYIPNTTPSQIKLDLDRFNYWLERGAQPTDTVRHLSQKVQDNKLTNLPVKTRKKKTKKEKQQQAEK